MSLNPETLLVTVLDKFWGFAPCRRLANACGRSKTVPPCQRCQLSLSSRWLSMSYPRTLLASSLQLPAALWREICFVLHKLSGPRHFVLPSSQRPHSDSDFQCRDLWHGSLGQPQRETMSSRPSPIFLSTLPHHGSTSLKHLAFSENLSSSITWPLSKRHGKLAPRVFLQSRENK